MKESEREKVRYRVMPKRYYMGTFFLTIFLIFFYYFAFLTFFTFFIKRLKLKINFLTLNPNLLKELQSIQGIA